MDEPNGDIQEQIDEMLQDASSAQPADEESVQAESGADPAPPVAADETEPTTEPQVAPDTVEVEEAAGADMSDQVQAMLAAAHDEPVEVEPEDDETDDDEAHLEGDFHTVDEVDDVSGPTVEASDSATPQDAAAPEAPPAVEAADQIDEAPDESADLPTGDTELIGQIDEMLAEKVEDAIEAAEHDDDSDDLPDADFEAVDEEAEATDDAPAVEVAQDTLTEDAPVAEIAQDAPAEAAADDEELHEDDLPGEFLAADDHDDDDALPQADFEAPEDDVVAESPEPDAASDAAQVVSEEVEAQSGDFAELAQELDADDALTAQDADAAEQAEPVAQDDAEAVADTVAEDETADEMAAPAEPGLAGRLAEMAVDVLVVINRPAAKLSPEWRTRIGMIGIGQLTLGLALITYALLGS